MTALLTLLAFLTAPAPADDPRALPGDLPAAAVLLIHDRPADLTRHTHEAGEADVGLADGALRVTVHEPAPEPWDVEVRGTGNREPVAAGEYVVLEVRARTVEAENEQQEAVIAVRGQLREEPWTAAVDGSAAVSREWMTVLAVGQSPADFAAGDLIVSLHLGAEKQVLELGDVRLYKLPADTPRSELPRQRLTWPGMSPDAAWRAPAAERIEAHRRGDLAITVVGPDGEPVEGATVELDMTEHAFWWGTFLGTAPAEDSPERRRQLAYARDRFNYYTVPIYWEDWGWEDPASREAYERTWAWARSTGRPFRVHTLIWPGEEWLPRVALDVADDPDALRELCLSHVREAVEASAPYDPEGYDVLNEPRVNTLVADVLGLESHVSWFELADELAPGATMYINDYGILSSGGHNRQAIDFYKTYLTDMLAAGAPVEGIGMQGHFGQGLTDPAKALAILDEFADFDLPVHITEFDIETLDEQGQAAYTRDFMTAMFSHASVEAFIVWGFWEGDHWKPDGAMLRRDFSEKPNAEVWRELIYETWWTDEQATTAADGTATLRGYLGTHDVTITKGDRTITLSGLELPRDGTTVRITLPDAE